MLITKEVEVTLGVRNIRYYENLAKYTDDVRFTENYLSQKDLYRSEVMSLWPEDSDIYKKERAFQLQERVL